MLKKELGVPVTLVQGDRGIFDVRVDGTLIYSKKDCGGRFPTGDEILARLRGGQ